MKHLKRSLSLALSLFLILSTMILTTAAADAPIEAPGGAVKSAADFVKVLGGESAATASEDGKTVTLKADVSLKAGIIISQGEYTLLSEGKHTIYRGDSAKVQFFQLQNENVSLTLGSSTGSDEDPTLILDGNRVVAERAVIDNSGKLTIQPGVVIRGNNRTATMAQKGTGGGGIQITSKGTVTMNGGLITANQIGADTVSMGGAGIFNGGGKFYMTGGKVVGNAAVGKIRGGGVYHYGGTTEITGGAILDNTTGMEGGGLYIRTDGCLVGGTALISENEAVNGGGIYLDSGSFELSGSAAVTKNTATHGTNSGGGVFVNKAEAVFTMKGGSISENNATGTGGGFLVNRGKLDLQGGKITGNTSGKSGPGVCIITATSISVSGPVIVGDENPIHLYDGKTVGITGELTGSIAITVDSYAEGNVVLSGSQMASGYEAVRVKQVSETDYWSVNAEGKLVRSDPPPTTPDTADGMLLSLCLLSAAAAAVCLLRRRRVV